MSNNETQAPKSKKITIGLVLSWTFGILFALTGISSVFSEPIPGIVMLIMAAILLPPVTKFVDQKWKFHFSGGMKIIIIIIGLIIFSATVKTPSTEAPQDTQTKIEKQQENTLGESSDEEQSQVNVDTQSAKTEKVETIPASDNKTKEEPKETPTETTKSDLETDTDTIIENHCQSEWPNDVSMKEYCKKQQYDGLTTLNQGKPSDILDSQFAIVRGHCKNEWPTDFSMRAYCEGQQYDGVRTLNQGKPSDIGDVEFSIIQPHCNSEWPSDFSMRAYCEKQQYNAVRTLNQGKPSNVSESDFQVIRSSCASEWPKDFTMRVYCEEQKY